MRIPTTSNHCFFLKPWLLLLALMGVLPFGFCQESEEGVVPTIAESGSSNTARFLSFEYRGMDPVFETELKESEYRNPILAGFYPDPSVCRVGDTYYLVNSSFSYFPGIPIFESKDLVNWRQIGHVLDRPSQLETGGLGTSRGVFAPAINYHDGIFYVVCTLVDAGGNFIVTASDPAGPWSDPIWLPEVGGIDPSLFFDEDGRCFLVHNDGPPNGVSLYQGHRAVYLWELDIQSGKAIAGPTLLINGGVDLSKEPVWIEGPHLYKIGDYYYLMCAEGGTGPQHSEVIFRSESIDGPFLPYPDPILTQRDLDPSRLNPVDCTGHADLVTTPSGDWWAVFLATRNYDTHFYNTGRETFLLPVKWTEDGWPIILEPGLEVPYVVERPDGQQGLQEQNLAFQSTGNFTWNDDFSSESLSQEWIYARTPDVDFVQEQDGASAGLALMPLERDLSDTLCPSVLLRRQQHTHFESELKLDTQSLEVGISAGLVIYQSEASWLYLGVRKLLSGRSEVFLETRDRDVRRVRKSVILAAENELQELTFAMRENAGMLDLWVADSNGRTTQIVNALDSKYLSTAVAGGFVGCTVGMFARAE